MVDYERSSLSLRGLQEVCVFVSYTTTTKEAGVDSRQIQADTELKLRLAGINAFSTEDLLSAVECLQTPARASLFVHLHVNKSTWPVLGDVYFNSIKLELVQEACLIRDSSITVPTVTWHIDWCQLIGELKGTRDAVKDLVDQFVNAYLSVNPKEER